MVYKLRRIVKNVVIGYAICLPYKGVAVNIPCLVGGESKLMNYDRNGEGNDTCFNYC